MSDPTPKDTQHRAAPRTEQARILDPSFQYVPASRTDVAATFKRIREQMNSKENQDVPRS